MIFDTDDTEGACLSQTSIDWLIKAKVQPLAIAQPWAVTEARVRFDRDLGTYEPMPAFGELALVFAVIDDGIIDLAAWAPKSGNFGSRLGIAWALGQGQIERQKLGSTGPKLPVFRNPLTWLQAERQGIVIMDWRRATLALAGLHLEPEDAAHAREIERGLVIPRPHLPKFRKAAA